MEEKDFSNIYAIPANFTDSGKIFGGMLELRNAVETVVLVVLIGYPEMMLIPMSTTVRIVVMTVTLIPLAVVSMMGVDGGSLFQFVGHMIKYLRNRRKLHFRRVGFDYGERKAGKKAQT